MTALVRYEIGEQIAIGGMGVVYAGVRLGEGGARTPVAFKQIREELAQDEHAAEQFIQEAQLCTMLQHPNIVSGLGLHRDQQGRLLLVMEYIDGIELAALRAGGRLPEASAVHIIRGMLQGLAYVHKRGIAHCDVSPHNVVIGRDGAVKLVDFGVSRFVAGNGQDAGTVRGKPRYLAPEQLRGAAGNVQADLYSVGVVLYELLTGISPFGTDAATINEVLAEVMCGSLRRPRELCPELSPAVESAVLRLLARAPDERYPTASAVLDDLPAGQDGGEIIAIVGALLAEPSAGRPQAAGIPEPQAVGAAVPQPVEPAGLPQPVEPKIEPHAYAPQTSAAVAPGRMRGHWRLALAAILGSIAGGWLVVGLSRTGPTIARDTVSEPVPVRPAPRSADLLTGPTPGEPVSASAASYGQDEPSWQRARRPDAQRSAGPGGNELPADANRPRSRHGGHMQVPKRTPTPVMQPSEPAPGQPSVLVPRQPNL